MQTSDPSVVCIECGVWTLRSALAAHRQQCASLRGDTRAPDVPSSVQQAHEEQRHLAAAAWDLRKRYGGAPIGTAIQLYRAGELGKVRCGSYDLAMRAKGTERDPVVYRRDGDEPPRGYDIALAAKRAKGAGR